MKKIYAKLEVNLKEKCICYNEDSSHPRVIRLGDGLERNHISALRTVIYQIGSQDEELKQVKATLAQVLRNAEENLISNFVKNHFGFRLTQCNASSSGLSTCSDHDFCHQRPDIPCLTYNGENDEIMYTHHELLVSRFIGHEFHLLPYTGSSGASAIALRMSGSMSSSANSNTAATAGAGDIDVNYPLWKNSLVGSIPATFGELKAARVLDLSHNWLNGSIPSGIGGAAALLELWLENNFLVGEIPLKIGNCSSLTTL
ncbi:hypothetical protein AgCh_020307 [Apium graveolens]